MPENEDREGPETCRTCERKRDYGDGGDGEVGREKTKNIWKSTRAVKNWIGGGLLSAGLLLSFAITEYNQTVLSLRGTDFFVSDLLFLLSIAVGGNVIILNGLRAIKKRELSIGLLMTSAILGSVIASIAGGEHIIMEGATLAFLFNFAELLESYSIQKAKGSLTELMDLSPDTALVQRDGKEEEVPVDEVEPGDTVIIRPGGRIPVDGNVVDGISSVNEAPITGESLPVNKEVGDGVYAGTINEQGYIEVEAKSRSSESTISKIIEMVKSSQRKKTEHEKFVEKFSSYYTPTVAAAALLIALIPPLAMGGPWTLWFVRGITMLVLACPCAFVISTPVTVVSGITSAARNGVLIESGRSLEAMGEVKAIAFDKTGTLTMGRLKVTDVIPLNGRSEEEVILCARGVEERSEHPIAEAITEHIEDEHENVDEREIEDFEEISGKGVKATLGGKGHFAGKPSLIEELGFDLEHVHHSSDSEKVREETTRICTRENCLNLADETIPDFRARVRPSS